MKFLHHGAEDSKPYLIGATDPELPQTASLIRYRHGVSSNLARLIAREHFGGGE